MKNRISLCFIVAGLVLINVPLAGSLYTKHKQVEFYNGFLEEEVGLESDSLQNIEEKNHSMNHREPSLQLIPFAADIDNISGNETNVKESNAVPSMLVEDTPTVLGRIEINKINVNLLLIEGAGPKELKWGAGHISGTNLPGENGNCGIAAHRNYTFGSYFSRLNELEAGDEVSVEYRGDLYNYMVNVVKTVLPEDNTVLQPPEEGELLTLVTCAPKGGNKYRLIVHCLPNEKLQ